ncbi:sulfurtransferase [Candidatus Poribacteria bacterium]|nr:sulfurtransferase [Candidatus Poribacteria bacterium]
MIDAVEIVDAGAWEPTQGSCVVDARPSALFARAHLPSALTFDVTRHCSPDLASPAATRRIGDWLSAAGIRSTDRVVLYDDGSLMQVGCALQLLDRVCHSGVAMLDGGIRRWHSRGKPLTNAMQSSGSVAYAPRGERASVVSMEWIMERIGDGDVVFVDARSAGEYSGAERESQKAGHIPGAVHFDWVRTLAVDASGIASLRATDALRAELSSSGITPDKDVVVYCQRGLRSAQLYGVLRALGFPRVRNYAGSWAEWGNHPSTLVEVSR